MALLLIAVPELSAAVTIYRFGGGDLPRPAEGDSAGVVFRQMDWGALDASEGGALSSVYIDDAVIGPGRLDRGRNVAPLLWKGEPRLAALFDNDPGTVWRAREYECGDSFATRCEGGYGSFGVINIDLSDKILIDHIQVLSGSSDNRFSVVKNVGISISPSRLGGNPTLLQPFLVEVRDNDERLLDLEISAEQASAAVQIALGSHSQPWEIAEIQIFASGVAGRASYTANIIDFGRPAVWGALRWSLNQEAESQAFLQTRNGGSSELFRYWKYTGFGEQKTEVTRAEYDKLRKSQRADPTYNYASWNPWTSRFDMANAATALPIFPIPRRSFQFQLEFVSSGEAGTDLEFLEFRASEAAVTSVVGELDPIQVEAGKLTRFTYAFKPRIQDQDPGFDRLEIQAVAARIDSVHGVRIDRAEVPFTVLSLEEQGAVLSIPRVAGLLYSDAVIEVAFDAQVLRYGGAFMGRIADSERPFDVPQPVLAGDAIDEAFGDRVWIETSTVIKSALTVVATPTTITPNGDGINDEVHIVYDVVEIIGVVPVRVEIRDLAGRRVRRLHAAEEQIGHYQFEWDGRFEDGRLVPPGIYLFRVTTEIDDDRFAQIGTLRVIY